MFNFGWPLASLALGFTAAAPLGLGCVSGQDIVSRPEDILALLGKHPAAAWLHFKLLGQTQIDREPERRLEQMRIKTCIIISHENR